MMVRLSHPVMLALVPYLLPRAAEALTKGAESGVEVTPITGEALEGGENFRQQLSNGGDAFYTLIANVGGQDVPTIPDTGSFEFLVFSKACHICHVQDAYDHTKSNTYSDRNFVSDQNFGSGSARSVEAFEHVRVGSMVRRRQVFWRVIDADGGFKGIAFGAILGLGPPSSIAATAESDVDAVQEEIDEMAMTGQDVTPFDQAVDHYKRVAKHAGWHTPLIKAAGMRSYSICLRPASGATGTWIWNDQVPMASSSVFTKVNAINSVYWSAKMQYVHLQGGSLDKAENMGCGDTPCNGVVDTGTSLLVMPSDAYKKFSSAVDKINKLYPSSSCDLSVFPVLKFKLGTVDLHLPPEAYVGGVDGQMADTLRALMPGAWEQLQAGGGGCTLLAITVDQESDNGPMWILGLPLFRKYYVNFRLSKDGVNPGAMYFADKDNECNPLAANSLKREESAGSKVLQVNASKIRVPRWVVQKVSDKHSRLFRNAANVSVLANPSSQP